MSYQQTLPRHLPSLGGMRFVAAIVVFGSHIAAQPFFKDVEVNAIMRLPLDRLGPIGVSFFFVLSGFVLAWAGMAGQTKPEFWRRRTVRVYSLHLPMFLVALGLVLWLNEPTMGRSVWDGALTNLFLIQSWFPDYHEFGSMNAVTWSLSCEMLFYFLFPFMFAWVTKIRTDRLWWWFGGASALIIAVPAIALLFPADPVLPWDPEMSALRYWFIDMFPPVRALEFLLGVLMAEILRRRPWTGPNIPICVTIFAVAYGATFVVPPWLQHSALAIPTVALLLGALGARDVRGSRSVLATDFMVSLGELTFAFYIVHYLVIQYGHRFLGGEQGYYRQWETPQAFGLTLAALVVSLGLAYLLNRFVENPVMRTFGRRSNPRVAEGAAASPPPVKPAPSAD